MYVCMYVLLMIRYSCPSVQKRPLPPVPDSDASSVPSSPVERRNRPLPATPAGVHLHPAASPPPSSRKKPPPLKPTPYRKNTSQPLPPEISPRHASVARSASLSPPPPPLLAEDYQEFVFTSQPDTEDNYSLATGGKHILCRVDSDPAHLLKRDIYIL